jgi:hypothetical protein
MAAVMLADAPAFEVWRVGRELVGRLYSVEGFGTVNRSGEVAQCAWKEVALLLKGRDVGGEVIGCQGQRIDA